MCPLFIKTLKISYIFRQVRVSLDSTNKNFNMLLHITLGIKYQQIQKKGLDNFRDYTSIARVTAVSPTNMKNFHVVHVINVILLRFAPYFREGKCAMFLEPCVTPLS